MSQYKREEEDEEEGEYFINFKLEIDSKRYSPVVKRGVSLPFMGL